MSKRWATGELVADHHVPSCCQQQRHGHVRCCAIDDARRIPDADPPFRSGLQIDVVDAHTKVADYFERRKAIHELGADFRMAISIYALYLAQ
jgi:hypothetical protein